MSTTLRHLAYLPVAALALPLLASGCADPKGTGAACTRDDECASQLCMHDICTRLCFAQTDCKVGFDCGLAQPDDGVATCYPREHDETPAAMGGFGAECGTVAPDPRTGAPCDPKAQSPCAPGFVCGNARRKCDAAAYCTRSCENDRQCPPSFFCATRSDMSRLCLRRTHCIPCITDDQCPHNHICATSPSGELYCAALCDDNTDCPLTADQVPFLACRHDLGSRIPPVKVCAPAANGLCHGPSAVAGVPGENTYCSWCRPGFPGDCGPGFQCYYDEYTTERFCSGLPDSCTVQGYAKPQGGLDAIPSTDSCQDISPGLYCLPNLNSCMRPNNFTPFSCTGICTGDRNYSNTTCYGT